MTAEAGELLAALVLGGVLGVGLWAMLAALPRWSAPALIRRVAPYVRDVTDAAGTTLRAPVIVDPGSAIASGMKAATVGVRRLFARLAGGADTLAARLQAAGSNLTVDAFRGRQLGVALSTAALAGLVAALLGILGRATGPTVGLPVLGGALGYIACDTWLTMRVRQRRERIQDELPTVLEFLTLCLAAGEGLTDSIRRASEVGSGALSAELRRVALDVSTGSSLIDALGAMGARVQVPAVRRAVEHLVAAVDRGAPLAAVLRDQAADARDEQKRELLEQAGKKEIQMLLPLVFLVLPLSILIAVYPGLQLIRLGGG